MKDRLNKLLKHPIKKVYFTSVLVIYLLISFTSFSYSFYTFLAYGQEIKEINTQIGYILTYDNQGGTGCTTKTQFGNQAWGTLCTPTKTGYEFVGWYTSQDGDGTEITATTTATSSITVYADYYDNTLYDVLKKAAKVGTYAREYTGNHQDSMNLSLSTKKIYHWYGSTAANGTAILDKNNVIFANHCWQMIRTTDTGGVRMIYNGEVVDDKCLNTRGTHVGYGGDRLIQDLNGTYWYGTDYTYDSSTSKFSLSGTTSSTQVTSSNASTVIPTLVGKYTCRSTSETGTCSTLYLIESYYSGYLAYAIKLTSSSKYSQYGALQFNGNYNSPAYVGYMYNTVYSTSSQGQPYHVASTSVQISSSHYYSDTISYDDTTNKYTLTNPIAISTLSDYSTLVGKYIGLMGQQDSINYVASVSSGTFAYCHSLSNGDLTTSLMIGDSYIDNGNGTYTINNATSISYVEWYNSPNATLSTYKGKYVCIGTSATCSNLMHIAPTNDPYGSSFYYFGTEHSYKYSESISYSNGTYTLVGDIKTIWDVFDSDEQTKLSTHHYTCLSDATTCSSIKYIYGQSGSFIFFMPLTGVSNIEEALTNMLSSNNVNTNNSTMKLGLDAWYGKYLLSYDSYVDDTIYCNDRSIRSLGPFNPNGGSVTSELLQFKEYNEGNDLSCTNVTDKFSISNSSAQLTYKVGLMSLPEMNLLNQANARKTGQAYWLFSPRLFASGYANGRCMGTGGAFSNYNIQGDSGVRPAISLIPGIEYSSGDGTMANPYVVDTN